MSDDHDELERKSKQQRKREAEAAQQVGAALVALSPAQFKRVLDKLDIPEDLQEALTLCRTIKAHEGRRRQLQYIGRLMRDIDTAPIQQMLDQLAQGNRMASSQLHQLERWRERLLHEGATALQELLDAHPQADAAQIKRLVASAQKELSENQPPRAARKLFKLLRELIHD
jgi:ribosome-associated protein